MRLEFLYFDRAQFQAVSIKLADEDALVIYHPALFEDEQRHCNISNRKNSRDKIPAEPGKRKE